MHKEQHLGNAVKAPPTGQAASDAGKALLEDKRVRLHALQLQKKSEDCLGAGQRGACKRRSLQSKIENEKS
jgi:hypothetical protein